MARKYANAARSDHTVLVIDDVPEVLESTRRLIESEGHRVLVAPDGPAGLALVDQEKPHLVLVDFFMPGMTGEEVVRRIREVDRLVQIVLVTGYAGDKPARTMMRQMEIQGYHDKSEGPERLLLWVDAALKAYRQSAAMEKQRAGLRRILDMAPELYRVKPLDDLLCGLLWQIEALMGGENSFLATVRSQPSDGSQRNGFVALIDDEQEEELEIRFGTGRYRRGISVHALPEPDRSLVQQALNTRTLRVQDGCSVVPLRLGEQPVGVLYIDRPSGQERDRELLEMFAIQAAAAIRNAILHELATTDSMTGVAARAVALRELRLALKRAARHADPVSVMMIDLDHFKPINDRFGHPVGDRVLCAVSQMLRSTIRETDTIGRYGGDEFIVVLPATGAAGAGAVADRVLDRMVALVFEQGGERIALSLSVGVGTLAATPASGYRGGQVERIAEALIARADDALLAAKHTGVAGQHTAASWEDVLQLTAA